MYCRFCGVENPDGSFFCKKCGKQIETEVTDIQSAQTVQPIPQASTSTQEKTVISCPYSYTGKDFHLIVKIDIKAFSSVYSF